MKFSIRMLILELLALVVLVAIVAAGLLAWRLSKGPLDMNILRPQVEAALSDARGGSPVEIQSLALAWSPDKKRIEATVRGITTYTADNNIDAKAKKGAVWFETAALLRGQFNIIKFRLEDGYTGLHRDKQGNWKIVSPNVDVFAEDDGGSVPKSDKQLVLGWRDWIPQLREHVNSQSFQAVEFVNFDIKLTDSVTGLNWQISDVSGIWTADATGLGMDLSGDLSGVDAPNAVQMRFFSDPIIENFSIELGVSGADPERLAALITEEDYPLKYNGVVDLKIGATANEKDGLLTAQISGAGENGGIVFGETEYLLDSISFEYLLDMKQRRIDLTELNLKSENLKGEFSGWANVSDYFNGSKNPKIPFEIDANKVWLDIQPMFSQAWDIDTFFVKGAIDTGDLSVDLETMSGGLKNFKGLGNGRIYLEPELSATIGKEPKSLGSRIGVEINATGEGSVSAQEVFKFWPVKLGTVGRDWAIDNVLSGRATSLNFSMDFPPGTTSKQIVPDKLLTLDFTVEEAKVSFLEDLPPIENASGTGRLRGNSLTVDLKSGVFGGWELSEGTVNLPAFHPAGAISQYKATGQGDLKALMQILEGSRLNLCTEYGLACSKMNGFGSLDISIERPMKKGTRAEDIAFDVTGGFVDANVPDLASGFGLEKSDVTVKLDNERLEIKGAGRFGGAPADFIWKQLLNTDKGTSLIANAIVSPDLLNSLGIAARSIMQGEADLQLEAYGDGREFDSIDMHVDFTGAALNLSEIGWVKPLYIPASGELRYGKAKNGESILTGDIVAKGLKLAGELNFNDDQGLQRATIERIYSENRMDMRGDLSRTTKGDVKINVSGPFFDASPWIDGLTQLEGGGVGPGVNVSANIAVDKLKLRDDAELLNSKIVLDFNPKRLQRGLVSGTIARGKGVEATFERDGEDIAFQLRSDDAGYVLRTLLKTEYLTGGTLSMSGLMGKELGTAEMNMRNVRLKGAPVLAEIFALASLRGLTDILSGDGVMFSEIQAPIRFIKGRIELPGVRASGPAMGLTTRGWFELDSGNLSLDGVVVPSFGVNSALGGIPIIGDLFVSRQGEGVFAVTYSVRGALERARVSINPLSAVTPGFLRRIMENPSEEPDDDS